MLNRDASASQTEADLQQQMRADRRTQDADRALEAVLQKSSWERTALVWIRRGLRVITGANLTPVAPRGGIVDVHPPNESRNKVDCLATFDSLLGELYVFFAEQLTLFEKVGSAGRKPVPWTPPLVRAIALFFVFREEGMCTESLRTALDRLEEELRFTTATRMGFTSSPVASKSGSPRTSSLTSRLLWISSQHPR